MKELSYRIQPGQFSVELFQSPHGSVSIVFDSTANRLHKYATDRIQKGLILGCGERELVEEGTGFGVPILKFGRETVFPGTAKLRSRLVGESVGVTIDYDLNLVQRMSFRNKPINTGTFYAGKEFFSSLHRKYPLLRSPLAMAANGIRRLASLRNRFELINTITTIKAVCSVYPNGLINVTLDLSGLKKYRNTEIIICNEMGANYFDGFEDSAGVVLTGKAIGTWDEVYSDRGSLTDSRDGITFTVPMVDGARLFRGRELVAGRLAWSGLNYVLTQNPLQFAYEIKVGAIL